METVLIIVGIVLLIMLGLFVVPVLRLISAFIGMVWSFLISNLKWLFGCLGTIIFWTLILIAIFQV